MRLRCSTIGQGEGSGADYVQVDRREVIMKQEPPAGPLVSEVAVTHIPDSAKAASLASIFAARRQSPSSRHSLTATTL